MSANAVPLVALECEWRSLQGRLALLYGAWSSDQTALARFETPSALLRFLHTPSGSPAKDEALAALLRLTPREPLAGRLVLEALLPGLKTLSRRVLSDASERESVWALLLACAWERIATYPLERRPRKIAANILLDTLASTLAALRSERPAGGELAEAAALPVWDRDDQGEEVEELLARAAHANSLDSAEARLILATRFEGNTLAAAADAAGVPYNTIKLRRQRAERRLLLFLGYPPVPRGPQQRPSSLANA